MKQIKLFNDFKETHINEGFFSEIWDKVVSTYKKMKDKYGDSAWLQYNKKLDTENKLPKGVEIYSPSTKMNEDRMPLEHPDDEIFNSDANEFLEEIEATYNLRVDTGKLTSMFVWGGPGIGKTDIVKQAAKKLDIELIIFHLSQIDPTDFRGLPIIHDIELSEKDLKDLKKSFKDEKTIKRSGNALPLVFPTNNGDNGKGGILFLDEMNLASDFVLKAAMPLALDGSYEGYDLPSNWIIISAGNRRDDVPDTDVTEIRGALGDRFLHLNYVATVEAWSYWAKNKEFVDPQLIAFLNFTPEWFHKLEKDDDQSSAWPSPRSWTTASEMIYHRGKKSFNVSDNIKRRVYQMSVGRAAMSAYMQYEKLVSIISEEDIKTIYKTGKLKKKLPTPPDTLNAVLNTIAYYKTGKHLTTKELDNMFNFAESLTSFEYTTSLMAALKAAHSDKNGNCYYHSESDLREIFDKHIDIWYEKYENMTAGNDI